MRTPFCGYQKIEKLHKNIAHKKQQKTTRNKPKAKAKTKQTQTIIETKLQKQSQIKRQKGQGKSKNKVKPNKTKRCARTLFIKFDTHTHTHTRGAAAAGRRPPCVSVKLELKKVTCGYFLVFFGLTLFFDVPLCPFFLFFFDCVFGLLF